MEHDQHDLLRSLYSLSHDWPYIIDDDDTISEVEDPTFPFIDKICVNVTK